jgi:hypothetical protein
VGERDRPRRARLGDVARPQIGRVQDERLARSAARASRATGARRVTRSPSASAAAALTSRCQAPGNQAASWKMIPSVVRSPPSTVATPWRIAAR